jgi:hypothetical protein
MPGDTIQVAAAIQDEDKMTDSIIGMEHAAKLPV